MILTGLSCELPGFKSRHGPATRYVAFDRPDKISPADVVLWSPAGSIAEYRTRFEQHGSEDEAPLLDLAGTETFLRDERRRRAELFGLLERGGVVIVDLGLDARVRIHTVETIFELDLAMVLPYPGAGASLPAERPMTVSRCTSGEPFRSFAAAVTESVPVSLSLTRHPGVPLAFSDGGEVVGFHAGVGTGHLIGLPMNVISASPEHADRLVGRIGALTGLLGSVRHGALPPWVDRYLLEEERERLRDLRRVTKEIARLQEDLGKLSRARERLRAGRALIYAGGRLLAEAASDAFRASGAAVYQAREGEGDLVVERDAALSVVAISEAAETDPGEVPQLAATAKMESLRAGLPARAVLLLAGEQDAPPDERHGPPIDPELLTSAEMHGVTLLTTLELFAMAQSAEAGAQWEAWLHAPPRPVAPPDWRRYLVVEGEANQSG